MCNATLQKDKAFLNIILFSEKPHQGNDPARYVSVLNKIYHILSKDKHFCSASKEWLFPCKPHHFKKELGKTVTSPSITLPPVQIHAWWQIQCHVHCLNIMRFVSSSLRHRSKKSSTPGFPCQTTLALVVLPSCYHAAQHKA